ncbi:NERD domain-containing protein [Klebsiella pneumoniae]|nr:NERD domain-containing protein [Klebsiella pneumoniae]
MNLVAAKKEGEFDLVIVTHCNVIIVELKDWNHQPVTARGDTWYKGDMNMGRSPVSVTRGKKIHYSMVMNKVTDKHNVLQEDRGIGKCMINRILWAVMN